MQPRLQGLLPVPGIEHGTNNAYQHHRCRCDACRAANAALHLARRRERLGAPPPSHGRSGYVNYGCRCPVCAAAHRIKCREYYQANRTRYRGYEERKKEERGRRRSLDAPVGPI